jgi:hypothetical protein
MTIITPLERKTAELQEAATKKEGWARRMIVAFDIFCNVVVFRGLPDETISSHAARAALAGKLWGKLLSRFLNLFQKDHGADAMVGDIARAEAVLYTENKTDIIEDDAS